LGRTDLRLLIGITTGHCTLNKHLFNMGIVQSANCTVCDEEETSPHLIGECPGFYQLRARTLGNYIVSEEDLCKLKPNQLLSFIKSCGRFENQSRPG